MHTKQAKDPKYSETDILINHAGNFLNENKWLAGLTTLGAGATAGVIANMDERPGESKRERALRTLRNSVMAAAGTGLVWAGGAGLVGSTALGKMNKTDKGYDNVSLDANNTLVQEGNEDGFTDIITNNWPGTVDAMGTVASMTAAGSRSLRNRLYSLTPGNKAYEKVTQELDDLLARGVKPRASKTIKERIEFKKMQQTAAAGHRLKAKRWLGPAIAGGGLYHLVRNWFSD